MNKDCFARAGKGCSILMKVVCKNGECPFYKTKKQYEEDKKKYPSRKEVEM